MQIPLEKQTEDTVNVLPAPREPPTAERCMGCPYPATGFMCWCDRECLRTEMARITALDKKKAEKQTEWRKIK